MERQQSPQLDATASLRAETDADLLVYMGWRNDDPETARAAGSVFYDRHVRYVYGVCRKAAHKYFMGDHCAKDLTAETFARVYERAGTFSPAGITDPEPLRLRVRGWIGAIANNIVMDALRGRQAAPEQHLTADAWEQQCVAPPAAKSADVALVRRAMDDVLDNREREVIRVTLLSYKPGAKQQRLSNADSADLASVLQTTPDNLRKIRRSAMRKIRDYVMSHRTETNGDDRQNAEGQQ